MKKKKADNNQQITWFYTILSIVMIVLYSMIILSTVFDNRSVVVDLSFWKILLGTIGVSVFLFSIWWFLQKKLINITKKQEMWIVLILFIIIIILQGIIGYYLFEKPGWDWKIVFENALEYARGNHDKVSWWYFQQFPNNVFLFVMQVICFKLLYICHIIPQTYLATLGASVVINIVAIDIAMILTWLTVRNLFGKQAGIFSIIMMIICNSFFTFIPILYTDTLALFIPIGMLYVYSCYLKKKELTWQQGIWYYVLFGILLFLGVKIKFTCVIMMIAIFMDLYFRKISWQQLGQMFGSIVCTFIICTLVFTGFQNIYFKELKGVSNTTNKVPYTHWIMMGLQEKKSHISGTNFVGAYHAPDYVLTFETPADKRVQKNVDEIIKRLKKHGVIGYPKFLYDKLQFTWNDGNYYGSALIGQNSVHKNNFIREIYNSDGKYNDILIIVQTGFNVYLYSMFIIICVYFMKDKKNESFVTILAIFGLLLFLLIWEATPKYLVHYIPIFIVTGIYGTHIIFDYIIARKKS
mgnify:CR=1 FL=1